MSGPICPDCGMNLFEEIRFGRLKCTICGWKGKSLPRKILGREKQQQLSQRREEYLRLKANSQLYFVRIWLKGDEDTRFTITDEIMDIFDISTVLGDERLFFEVSEKPEKDIINQVKKMREVKRITIF